MPKEFYGESGNTMKPGEFPAVISQVAVLGHHKDKDGVERMKLWFSFYVPDFGKNIKLAHFGINTWTSPSKPPFIGLNEIICAALDRESIESKEAEEVNVFSLLGKNVILTLEDVEGKDGRSFTNITKLSPCGLGLQHDDLVEVTVADYTDFDLLSRLEKRAQDLIRESREFQELQKPIQIDDVTDMPLADEVEIQDADTDPVMEDADPSKVPF